MEITIIAFSLLFSVMGIVLAWTASPRTPVDYIFGGLLVAVGYGLGALFVGISKMNLVYGCAVFMTVCAGISLYNVRRPRYREEPPPARLEAN